MDHTDDVVERYEDICIEVGTRHQTVSRLRCEGNLWVAQIRKQTLVEDPLSCSCPVPHSNELFGIVALELYIGEAIDELGR